jgi:hypothetical protein
MKSPADYEVGDTVAYGFDGFVIAKIIRRTACYAVLDNGHRFHRKTGFVVGVGREVMDYSDPQVQQRLAEGRMNPKFMKDS